MTLNTSDNPKVFISNDFRRVLELFKDKSEVSRMLLDSRINDDSLEENYINYIGISHTDVGKISYLTTDRIAQIENTSSGDYWTSSKRFHCKPGGFVSKIFKNIDAKEVEIFSNLYKTFTAVKEFDFRIVKGDEIKKYYLEENYHKQNGSLGASCMKHQNCQDFFSIYCDNSNVSMLIMLSSNEKLMGRALLWESESNKIMDRIYTISDYEYVGHFTKWASDNGYMHRVYQNWANSIQFVDGKDEIEKEFSIQLTNWEYKKYPYLDTFKWLDVSTGKLYNYCPKDFIETENLDTKRVLASGGGGYENSKLFGFDFVERSFSHRSELVRVDDNENRLTRSNNCYFSNMMNCYILSKEGVYSTELEDYIYLDNSRNPQEKIQARIDYINKVRERNNTRSININSNHIFDTLRSNIYANSISDIVDRYVDRINSDTVQNENFESF